MKRDGSELPLSSTPDPPLAEASPAKPKGMSTCRGAYPVTALACLLLLLMMMLVVVGVLVVVVVVAVVDVVVL